MTKNKKTQIMYKGCLFDSRLEAKWAVFFDACGVEWEYRPEEFDLDNGVKYQPSFLLHDVKGVDGGKLYIAVTNKVTFLRDEIIERFNEIGLHKENGVLKRDTPILILTGIPAGDGISNIAWHIRQAGLNKFVLEPDWTPIPFFFGNIDDTIDIAMPGVNRDGLFEIFRLDFDLAINSDIDEVRTVQAYQTARQVRFEHDVE